jgi:hypothetical protein
MSFLSLSKGDPAARDLLLRAIRARYGMRPLPIDSVRLEMLRQDKGPLGLPVKIVISNTFVTASHWRWDEVRKLFGLTIGKFSARFDSSTYYRKSGKTVTRSHDPRVVQGMACRVWLEAAFWLTPLTSPDVTIKAINDCTFRATPKAETEAIIQLNPDDTVAAVESRCYHPEYEREMRLAIKPGGGLQAIDGFTIPRHVIMQWDDKPALSFTVTKAEANPTLPLNEFSMG